MGRGHSGGRGSVCHELGGLSAGQGSAVVAMLMVTMTWTRGLHVRMCRSDKWSRLSSHAFGALVVSVS